MRIIQWRIMNIKIQATGKVSIKFKDHFGPFKWDKTITSNIDQMIDVANIKFGATRTLSIPGPADIIVSVSEVDGLNIITAKLIADGSPWVLYEASMPIDAKKELDKVQPLRIRVNNVRGVTVDVSLKTILA